MIIVELLARLFSKSCTHDWIEYERTFDGFATWFLFRCTRCPKIKSVRLSGRVFQVHAYDQLERMFQREK